LKAGFEILSVTLPGGGYKFHQKDADEILVTASPLHLKVKKIKEQVFVQDSKPSRTFFFGFIL
jgi:hypothetical protein